LILKLVAMLDLPGVPRAMGVLVGRGAVPARAFRRMARSLVRSRVPVEGHPRLRGGIGRRRAGSNAHAMVLWPGPGLVEFGQRSFEFAVEEEHRIEDFAEGYRGPRSVGAAKREHAVVPQVTHDPRVGHPLVGKGTRPESRPGRTRDDLNELEQLHLVDRI